MGWKKKLLGICVGVFALTCVAYVLHAQELKFSTTFSQQEPLHIIHGRSARIRMSNDRSGRIMIKSVSESVAYFSNQPEKMGGTLSMIDFVDNWAKEEIRDENRHAVAALIFFSTDLENYGSRQYGELTMNLTSIEYHSTHDVLEIEFELLGDSVEIPMGRLLEPTLFVE